MNIMVDEFRVSSIPRWTKNFKPSVTKEWNHVAVVQANSQKQVFYDGQRITQEHDFFHAILNVIHEMFQNKKIPNEGYSFSDNDFTVDFFVKGLKPRRDDFREAVKQALVKQGLWDEDKDCAL